VLPGSDRRQVRSRATGVERKLIDLRDRHRDMVEPAHTPSKLGKSKEREDRQMAYIVSNGSASATEF
jgi:hypothetical protein